MRPGGPGLVVMALAFLSGARRSTSQQSTPIKGGKFDRVGDDSTGSLGRINPWLSACDLAQPNSAPDLQVLTTNSNNDSMPLSSRIVISTLEMHQLGSAKKQMFCFC